MMKKTILLSNNYKGLPRRILEEAVGDRFHLALLSRPDQEELYERVSGADYLLVSGRLKVDEELIRRAKKLKMVQRTGVGLDNIDLACLKKYGIPLYVNRGVNAVSVAEHTLMLMLSTIRNSYRVNCLMRQGIWKKQETGLTTHELSGKCIGLVGLGSIGRLVVKMLSGFDVRILYYDQVRLGPDQEESLGVIYRDFPDILKEVDILSLHCALDPSGTYLISDKEFDRMKEGAVLINTARGRLVEEEALIRALDSGRLSACGIDTFETEPPAGTSRLAAYKQALLSPHIAGVSYEAFSRMMGQAIGNITAFDEGDLASIEGSRRL